MAPYSSTLAWKIPWMEEPGRLQSMGSLRVRHDWATSLSLFTFMHWRRKWQPTPVFLPGESQGRGILVGCGLWGCTEVRHNWSDSAAAAAYNRFSLVMYFIHSINNVYMSISTSQFIPLPTFPLGIHTFPFFLSFFLFFFFFWVILQAFENQEFQLLVFLWFWHGPSSSTSDK